MALSKPAGYWTYDDLLSLPEDKRYEIIEGELYEMPAPNLAHAAVIANLIAMLIPLVTRLRGRWFTGSLDVFFEGANPVQPDNLVILPGWRGALHERGVGGPPDLVIEVLSPSNRGYDLLTKRALYGRAGVREYWIVDAERRTLEIFALERDALHRVALATGAEAPDSPLLGLLPLGVEDLFAGADG